jgi:hypothetical protein
VAAETRNAVVVTMTVAARINANAGNDWDGQHESSPRNTVRGSPSFQRQATA